MAAILYSATGCVRCATVRQLLDERGLKYQEHDALGEGRKNFRDFYQNNRRKIFRGPEGIEFPIFYEGSVIRQGLSMVAAHLMSGPALEGFFRHGVRHGQWVDGILISGGDPTSGDAFLQVLSCLKGRGYKIQIDTNGLNADLLETVLERHLADCAVMEVKGPLDLYNVILQQPVDPAGIKKSIAAVSKFGEYSFFTTIAPVERQKNDPGEISYIKPGEVAQAAYLIKTATGSTGQSYRLNDARWIEKNNIEFLEKGQALSSSSLQEFFKHITGRSGLTLELWVEAADP